MARPSVEAQRREQILRAACEVIRDKGINALRVSDVAARAGMSTGAVHYYFETKRALTHAAFEWNFTRSLARREVILTRRTSPSERLRAFVSSYLPGDDETTAAWHVWAETWVEALHDAELRALNERVYEEWRSMITEIIRDGQADGTIIDRDPVLLADTVVSLVDGLSMQALVGSRHMTASRMHAVCEHLIDAISVSSGRVKVS
ncbi:MAG: TetR/AcrR family transcriptional regulator [Intrasporangium sp.]|uniref:TetR/AcrR family transcriptional regulator n=1 Tax=Intrasporangium sp. TaxID=1925024 RepID=UPI0026486635|nr:TetR/AcrR family transcriptional regulator [Intrasporangium sp.]MDN5796584.1 TetR/AcrR family transcriptional regulator [Intrasporangium sp.]